MLCSACEMGPEAACTRTAAPQNFLARGRGVCGLALFSWARGRPRGDGGKLRCEGQRRQSARVGVGGLGGPRPRRAAHPPRWLCVDADGQGRKMAPALSFVPGEQSLRLLPLKKALREEQISPAVSQAFSRRLSPGRLPQERRGALRLLAQPGRLTSPTCRL